MQDCYDDHVIFYDPVFEDLVDDEVKLMWDYYRIVRGPEQLRQVVDTNYSRSILTIFLKEANFVDMAWFLAGTAVAASRDCPVSALPRPTP